MKFMVEYTFRRAGLSHEGVETYADALIKAFAAWKPENLTVHAFLTDVADTGGYALLETEDDKALSLFTHQFAPFVDIRIVPVLDARDSVPIAAHAKAWRASVLKA